MEVPAAAPMTPVSSATKPVIDAQQTQPIQSVLTGLDSNHTNGSNGISVPNSKTQENGTYNSSSSNHATAAASSTHGQLLPTDESKSNGLNAAASASPSPVSTRPARHLHSSSGASTSIPSKSPTQCACGAPGARRTSVFGEIFACRSCVKDMEKNHQQEKKAQREAIKQLKLEMSQNKKQAAEARRKEKEEKQEERRKKREARQADKKGKASTKKKKKAGKRKRADDEEGEEESESSGSEEDAEDTKSEADKQDGDDAVMADVDELSALIGEEDEDEEEEEEFEWNSTRKKKKKSLSARKAASKKKKSLASASSFKPASKKSKLTNDDDDDNEALASFISPTAGVAAASLPALTPRPIRPRMKSRMLQYPLEDEENEEEEEAEEEEEEKEVEKVSKTRSGSRANATDIDAGVGYDQWPHEVSNAIHKMWAHSSSAFTYPPTPIRVTILGAGVAGLVAAHECARRGFHVTVVEARSRIGGRVSTMHWTDPETTAEAAVEEEPKSRRLKAKLKGEPTLWTQIMNNTNATTAAAAAATDQMDTSTNPNDATSAAAASSASVTPPAAPAAPNVYPIDLGAAFLHGCDPDELNPVYEFLRQHQTHLVTKYDTNDIVYKNKGAIVPNSKVVRAWSRYEMLDMAMLDHSYELHAYSAKQKHSKTTPPAAASSSSSTPTPTTKKEKRKSLKEEPTSTADETATPASSTIKTDLVKIEESASSSSTTATTAAASSTPATPTPTTESSDMGLDVSFVLALQQLDEKLCDDRAAGRPVGGSGVKPVKPRKSHGEKGVSAAPSSTSSTSVAAAAVAAASFRELDAEDRELLSMISTTQHAYCAELRDLSLKDLKSSFEAGVLGGDYKVVSPGPGQDGYSAVIEALREKLLACPNVKFVLNTEVNKIEYGLSGNQAQVEKLVKEAQYRAARLVPGSVDTSSSPPDGSFAEAVLKHDAQLPLTKYESPSLRVKYQPWIRELQIPNEMIKEGENQSTATAAATSSSSTSSSEPVSAAATSTTADNDTIMTDASAIGEPSSTSNPTPSTASASDSAKPSHKLFRTPPIRSVIPPVIPAAGSSELAKVRRAELALQNAAVGDSPSSPTTAATTPPAPTAASFIQYPPSLPSAPSATITASASTVAASSSATPITDSSIGVRIHTSTVRFDESTNEVVRENSVSGTIESEYILVTASIGVLQSSLISFSPPLPQAKSAAIASLGMGCENKVILQFPKCFWPKDKHYLRQLKEHRYKFLNLEAFGCKNILVAQAPPPHSYQLSSMTDDEVIEEVLTVLKNMFGASAVPAPCKTRITRWHDDPYARGSYSYVRKGSSTDRLKDYARPIGPVFFAGEGAHVTDGQTVHGAWMASVIATQEMAKRAATVSQQVGYFEPILPTPQLPRNARLVLKRKEYAALTRRVGLVDKITAEEEALEAEDAAYDLAETERARQLKQLEAAHRREMRQGVRARKKTGLGADGIVRTLQRLEKEQQDLRAEAEALALRRLERERQRVARESVAAAEDDAIEAEELEQPEDGEDAAAGSSDSDFEPVPEEENHPADSTDANGDGSKHPKKKRPSYSSSSSSDDSMSDAFSDEDSIFEDQRAKKRRRPTPTNKRRSITTTATTTTTPGTTSSSHSHHSKEKPTVSSTAVPTSIYSPSGPPLQIPPTTANSTHLNGTAINDQPVVTIEADASASVSAGQLTPLQLAFLQQRTALAVQQRDEQIAKLQELQRQQQDATGFVVKQEPTNVESTATVAASAAAPYGNFETPVVYPTAVSAASLPSPAALSTILPEVVHPLPTSGVISGPAYDTSYGSAFMPQPQPQPTQAELLQFQAQVQQQQQQQAQYLALQRSQQLLAEQQSQLHQERERLMYQLQQHQQQQEMERQQQQQVAEQQQLYVLDQQRRQQQLLLQQQQQQQYQQQYYQQQSYQMQQPQLQPQLQPQQPPPEYWPIPTLPPQHRYG